MCSCLCDCLLVVLAVLFPPLPVWLICGFCSSDSIINVLLFFLGYFPGLIHAWYLIATRPVGSVRRGPVAVYYVYHDDIESQINPRPGPVDPLRTPRQQGAHATPSVCLHTATYGSVDDLRPAAQQLLLASSSSQQQPHPPRASAPCVLQDESPCDYGDQPPPSYHEGDHKHQR